MNCSEGEILKERRRVSVIAVQDGQLLGFDAIEPYFRKPMFLLPGGKVEEDESLIECAQRETLEETGYETRVDESSALTDKYDFFWDGEMVRCTTTYFKAQVIKQLHSEVDDANYHRGVRWIPIDLVKKEFSYHDAILKSVLHLLRN